jgi:hypothetical protein
LPRGSAVGALVTRATYQWTRIRRRSSARPG